MYRDCILPAIYSDSQATMDTASEPGVRGTSFRAFWIAFFPREECNPHRKGTRERGSHAKGQLPNFIEKRVRKRHEQISEEVGNVERTKDGTNKMRDILRQPL